MVLVSTLDDRSCFIDQCVPPGEYQYGFQTPYTCLSHSCGQTLFYEIATTTATIEGCQRTVAAPAAYTGAVPWGSSKVVCGGGVGEGVAGGCGSAGFHRSTTAPPVLMLNAVFLLVGLLLWRRRAPRAQRL